MNHPTHFRKITILRFVLAGLVLLFSVPALFADGIASRYPNDVGIENDPDVILYDGFETYTYPIQMKGKWDHVFNAPLMRIATEPGNFAAGKKSLEMHLPITTVETGTSVEKLPYPHEPVLFVRSYEKWDSGYNIQGSGHNGIRIRGGHYLGPGVPAPKDGTGFFVFLMQNNFLSTTGETQPGATKIYSYWPLQMSNYGDNWLPNGYMPWQPGPWLVYPTQYPNFVPMPVWRPLRGVWYCFEFMVKLNTVGYRNGEVAFWVNGQLKGRWTNLFIRSISSLLIDNVALTLSNQHSERVNKKWYDSVVIARSYIGPISPPKPISRAAVADFNSDGHKEGDRPAATGQ